MKENSITKQIKSFTHFVSRDAINIEGLSEATIEKLIAKGMIKELADIFHIGNFKTTIVQMEGFGEKSFENLVKSVNNARKTTAARLLYSLGIANIGLSNARLICRKFNDDWHRIENAELEELTGIPGVGGVMAANYIKFFNDENKRQIVKDILKEVELEKSEKSKSEQIFENINFVITGSVERFKNRDELKALIEKHGGKVTGSVTTKTNYLINNDNTSNSSKNKKAKELEIPIITENEFIERFNVGVEPK